MPVVHIFSPSIRQPATPSRLSRTARVSMWVASEPCCGSVSPKVTRILRASDPRMNFSFCSWVPKSRSITMKGKLPTTECSFCRSLCSPRPCVARCSRITAIQRLPPPWPPNSVGQREAEESGLVRQRLGLFEQGLPFRSRQPAIVEVGPRPLAAMVEETLVVVLRLQRLDFGIDEGVDLGQIFHEILGYVEIHR